MKPGEQLPALEIPVTRTLVVAGAIASRDYQDVHHDAERARQKGSPDIFMNILTTNGLVGRYITDHFGPTAVLHRVAIRLGAPNYPGDTMVLRGTVEEVTETPAGTTATVRVLGENGIGRHVTGTVTVTVPSGADVASEADAPARAGVPSTAGAPSMADVPRRAGAPSTADVPSEAHVSSAAEVPPESTAPAGGAG